MAGCVGIEIRLRTREQGGYTVSLSRDTPGSYRPHLRVIGTEEWLGVAVIDGPDEPVQPGESAFATAALVYEPNVDYDALTVGAEFEILEGPNVVGTGRVIQR